MIRLVFCQLPGGNGTYVIGRDADVAEPLSSIDESGGLYTHAATLVASGTSLRCPFIVRTLPVEKINDRIRFFKDQEEIEKASAADQLICTLPQLVPDELLLNSVGCLGDYLDAVMEIPSASVLTSHVVMPESIMGRAYETTAGLWLDASSPLYQRATKAMDFDVEHFIRALADPERRASVIYRGGAVVQ